MVCIDYSEVKDFQKFVQIFNDERKQLFQDLSTLAQDYKILLRERDHYETVLKLILREKVCDSHNAYHLLEALMSKLASLESKNNIIGDGSEASAGNQALLEGALEVVQEQNNYYRDQISKLTNELETFKDKEDSQNCEILAKYNDVCCQLESMHKEFIANEKMLNKVMKTVEDKESQIQQLNEQISSTYVKPPKNFSPLRQLFETP